ncbi:MAG TPA: ROK family glucokinase [Candidatus Hydrogenedens sp.]|nr:ROK family glucokinase [Candidatus Hydrogenedens sp.]HPP59223.1 ROK family glucokinase [Candidatus Hydrogenedens sp.]
MSKYIVGVDLGGTNIKSAIVSEEKKIIVKTSVPTPTQEGPVAIMDAMANVVHDLMNKEGLTTKDILAVGIGAPGPMNWQTGVVYSPPNLPGWHNVPLADEMQKRLNVPCYIENDANAACFGEYWLGAGQGCDCIAVLTLGTGVGGGIVVFKKLLRGIDGTAGELGHLKVQRDGRLCGCGSKGCLEAYASVTGMVRTAQEKIEKGEKTILTEMCNNNIQNITGKMIFQAVEKGDAIAKEVFHETAVWLGLGIASIVNMLNPERVILCGGMISAGDVLFTPVRETVMKNAFEVPAKRCEIVPAGLGEDSGVFGCAGCALTRYYEAHK